jgi:hypothetical protein
MNSRRMRILSGVIQSFALVLSIFLSLEGMAMSFSGYGIGYASKVAEYFVIMLVMTPLLWILKFISMKAFSAIMWMYCLTTCCGMVALCELYSMQGNNKLQIHAELQIQSLLRHVLSFPPVAISLVIAILIQVAYRIDNPPHKLAGDIDQKHHKQA